MWNPDKEFKGYKADIAIDKNQYFDDEPVMLTLKITDGRSDKASWSLFTPSRLRISDEKGKDVDFLAYPVSGTDDVIRSKLWGSIKEKTFDLTSFTDPYYGVEYIYRFPPGKYTITYYFYSNSRKPIGVGSSHLDGECRWGKLHSNTIPFEISERKPRMPIDTEELFRKASKLIDENKPEEAVGEFRKIVASTSDFPTVRRAIENIIIIRHLVHYNDVLPAGKKANMNRRPPSYGDNLRKGIEDFAQKSRKSRNQWIEPLSLGLSLLHVPMETRKEIVDRFLKCPDHFWVGGEIDKAEEEFFKDFRLGDFIAYPQLRSILEEKIANPKTCKGKLMEIYLKIPEQDFPKSPETMLAFLRLYPPNVLEYYTENQAPKELVPFIAQYFDDEKTTWGNGAVQAHVSDAAFAAFETAVGFNLGFQKDPTRDYDRISFRDIIKTLLKRWWKIHGYEYGFTENTGDELILARIKAMREADEARFGVIKKVSEENGHFVVDLDRTGIIGEDNCGSNDKIHIANGINLPENLKEGAKAVICINYEGDPLKFEEKAKVNGSNCIWIIPPDEIK